MNTDRKQKKTPIIVINRVPKSNRMCCNDSMYSCIYWLSFGIEQDDVAQNINWPPREITDKSKLVRCTCHAKIFISNYHIHFDVKFTTRTLSSISISLNFMTITGPTTKLKWPKLQPFILKRCAFIFTRCSVLIRSGHVDEWRHVKGSWNFELRIHWKLFCSTYFANGYSCFFYRSSLIAHHYCDKIHSTFVQWAKINLSNGWRLPAIYLTRASYLD